MIVAARTVSRATIDGAWIETPQTFAVKASKKSSAKSGHVVVIAGSGQDEYPPFIFFAL